MALLSLKLSLVVPDFPDIIYFLLLLEQRAWSENEVTDGSIDYARRNGILTFMIRPPFLLLVCIRSP